jgi:hypothetical protein
VNSNKSVSGFCPDGLDEAAIDALIAETDAVLAVAPVPTSRLIDGPAVARRCRRIERRALAAVRVLPVRPYRSEFETGEVA